MITIMSILKQTKTQTTKQLEQGPIATLNPCLFIN